MITDRAYVIKSLQKYIDWKITFNKANSITESRKGDHPTNTELFQLAADMLAKDEKQIKKLSKKPTKREVHVIVHKS